MSNYQVISSLKWLNFNEKYNFHENEWWKFGKFHCEIDDEVGTCERIRAIVARD